jgi:hypothetical protein
MGTPNIWFPFLVFAFISYTHRICKIAMYLQGPYTNIGKLPNGGIVKTLRYVLTADRGYINKVTSVSRWWLGSTRLILLMLSPLDV